jgi:hypothetical protein
LGRDAPMGNGSTEDRNAGTIKAATMGSTGKKILFILLGLAVQKFGIKRVHVI